MKKYSIITVILFMLSVLFISPSAFSMTGGEITGKIYYNGNQTGCIKIVAVTVSPTNINPFNYKVVNIDNAGPFEFSCLDNGLYFVGAFMDINGDNLPHYNEPLGFYRWPIYITNESKVSNIDFSLKNLPRGGSSINGKIVYAGSKSGKYKYVKLIEERDGKWQEILPLKE